MPSHSTLVALFVLGSLAFGGLAACGHPDPSTTNDAGSGTDSSNPSCALGFLGTAGQPVQLKLTVRGVDLTSTDIADGSRIPLILPPQGGRVVFVGASATNLSACGVTLTGSIRDTTTSQVRVDARTVNLQPTGDGWGASSDGDISTFSNIPLCPNQWASTDAFEHPFELTVTVKDPAGNKATKTISVTPFCAEPTYAAECLCECQKGYVLGQTCGDAGK